jgi:hypothetical protein
LVTLPSNLGTVYKIKIELQTKFVTLVQEKEWTGDSVIDICNRDQNIQKVVPKMEEHGPKV